MLELTDQIRDLIETVDTGTGTKFVTPLLALLENTSLSSTERFFAIERIRRAQRYMESGEGMSRLLLKLSVVSQVKV